MRKTLLALAALMMLPSLSFAEEAKAKILWHGTANLYGLDLDAANTAAA